MTTGQKVKGAADIMAKEALTGGIYGTIKHGDLKEGAREAATFAAFTPVFVGGRLLRLRKARQRKMMPGYEAWLENKVTPEVGQTIRNIRAAAPEAITDEQVVQAYSLWRSGHGMTGKTIKEYLDDVVYSRNSEWGRSTNAPKPEQAEVIPKREVPPEARTLEPGEIPRQRFSEPPEGSARTVEPGEFPARKPTREDLKWKSEPEFEPREGEGFGFDVEPAYREGVPVEGIPTREAPGGPAKSPYSTKQVEKLQEITEAGIEGEAGTMGGMMPDVLEQIKRGATRFMDDGSAVVTLFEDADFSTLVHEMSHIWRRQLPEAMLKQVEKIMGVKNGKWTREAEEQFASWFESYIGSGIAPNPGSKLVFEKYAQWMNSIYKGLDESPLREDISPEMHTIFSKMLNRTPGKAAPEIVEAAARTAESAAEVADRSIEEETMLGQGPRKADKTIVSYRKNTKEFPIQIGGNNKEGLGKAPRIIPPRSI